MIEERSHGDGNLLAEMHGVTGYDGCIVLPAVYSVNL